MSDPQVFTISELTRRIKTVLEEQFPYVWVSGEISNCTRPSSGHCYLTLKDDASQLRGILWRGTASRLKFELQDGLEVLAGGRLEVYEARGSYQLIIEACEPKGVGALELAFRQLCAKLEAEGLFSPEDKQPIPLFPRRVALVTSPTSAAVRDMLQVITRRWSGVDILLIPVAVQGEGAAEQIAKGLHQAALIPDVDVVITGRGGGSLEDLWSFNEEIVARAIHACPKPVISAVGHEIDVTIADLVADRRALTPSEAGELVVPDATEIGIRLRRLQERLSAGLKNRLRTARQNLDAVAARRVFTHPSERIHDLQQQLDEIDVRLQRAVSQILGSSRQQLSRLAAALNALSPLRVLERGYSITRDAKTGSVMTAADENIPGNLIETILAQGRLLSRIESIDTTQNSAT